MEIRHAALSQLLKRFARLSDPRRCQGKRHSQALVLGIVVLATMSGYLGYRAIDDFLQKHKAELFELFRPAQDRLPSYSTIRRVLMQLDFVAFCTLYEQWVSEQHASSAKQLCIDGKALRGSVAENGTTHLVSVFCPEQEIVLRVAKVENKSNEIPIVQRLIRDSQLTGKVFTLDALHCQKKTTDIIIHSGNDYILAVKKNQPTLYHSIQTQLLDHDPVDRDYTLERNRGRIEERVVSVYQKVEGLPEGWNGLEAILEVQRKTLHIKANKTTEETAYYISSLDTQEARLFNQTIRTHWHIENGCHRTQDVVFKEDASKIRTQNAPQNMSLIRTWTQTIFRKNHFQSMTKAIRTVANDFSLMLHCLTEAM